MDEFWGDPFPNTAHPLYANPNRPLWIKVLEVIMGVSVIVGWFWFIYKVFMCFYTIGLTGGL